MTHVASPAPRDRSVERRALCAVFDLAPLAVPGCVAGGDGIDDSSVDDGEAAITRAQAVSRADEWVNAKLHYCQSPNHQRDYDTACFRLAAAANQHWVSGDFDGDGKTDLAKYWNDGGQWTADVHLSSGRRVLDASLGHARRRHLVSA